MAGERAFRRAVGLTSDPRVQPLGIEFGPGAILCYEEVLALYTDNACEGAVEIEFAVLAHRAFVSARRSREILLAAADRGLIVIAEQTPKALMVNVPAYGAWNPADPTNAERQARYRERYRNGEVTPATVTSNGSDKKKELPVGKSPSVPERAIENTNAFFLLSSRLANLMLANDPKAAVDPESKAWIDPMRLLVERDKRSIEEVERVIDWSQADDFNRKTVHSPFKLRKRFTELWLKSQAAGVRTAMSASRQRESLMETHS